MATGLSSSSSGSGANFQRVLKEKPKMGRHLAFISQNQQTLLDHPDAWQNNIVNDGRQHVNLPPDILNSIIDFHASRNPPPAAQKPLSSSEQASSARYPAGEFPRGSLDPSEDDASAPDSEDDEDDAGSKATDWNPSPEHHFMRPHERAQYLRDNADANEPSSSRAGSEPAQPQTPTRMPPSSSQSEPPRPVPRRSAQQSRQPVMQTQLPLSSVSSTSTPNVLSGPSQSASGPLQQSQVPSAQPRQSSSISKPSSASMLPPSSDASDDEFSVVIPGTVDHATPPIVRHAARLQLPQGSAVTPTCGQRGIIPSTYATATKTPVATSEATKQTPEKVSKPGGVGKNGRPRKMRAVDFSGMHEGPAADQTVQAASPAKAGTKVGSDASGQEGASVNFKSAGSENSVSVADGHQPKAAKPPKELQRAASISAAKFKSPAPPNPQDQSMSSESLDAMDPMEIDVKHAGDTRPAQPQEPSYKTMQKRFNEQPFEAFKGAYPSFEASLDEFVQACVYVQRLRCEHTLPQFLHDDFIGVYCGRYLDYVEFFPENSSDEPLLPWAFYVEKIQRPTYQKNLIMDDNLLRVFKKYPREYDHAKASLGRSRSVSHEKGHSPQDVMIAGDAVTQPKTPPAQHLSNKRTREVLDDDEEAAERCRPRASVVDLRNSHERRASDLSRISSSRASLPELRAKKQTQESKAESRSADKSTLPATPVIDLRDDASHPRSTSMAPPPRPKVMNNAPRSSGRPQDKKATSVGGYSKSQLASLFPEVSESPMQQRSPRAEERREELRRSISLAAGDNHVPRGSSSDPQSKRLSRRLPSSFGGAIGSSGSGVLKPSRRVSESAAALSSSAASATTTKSSGGIEKKKRGFEMTNFKTRIEKLRANGMGGIASSSAPQ